MSGQRRLGIALLGMLFCAGGSWAQGLGTIRGRIVDAIGAGVGGVEVTIVALAGARATSDDEGGFTISDVPAGTYTLDFSLGSYTATEDGVAVVAGGTASVETTVDWEINYADTITVFSASKRQERIVDAPAAVTTLSELQIAREAPGGQLPKLLEFTPGAEVTQSGLYDFNFNTRGLNSSLNRRIVTLIDGRDPSVPFLGAQEWAAVSFPMDEIQSAELVRGPSSALYGANAYNGVLNMVTKAPRDNEGGQVRLTAGELATVHVDARYAAALGGDWYIKGVGGLRQSDDYTLARNTAVREYAGLPREAIAPVLTEDEIYFGGLRVDKHIGSHVLTIEGGDATIEGPVFQTGIGRVQLLDVERPWGRINWSHPRFNVLLTHNERDASGQVSLASGGGLVLDEENSGIEVQGNASFFDDRARIVGGLTYGEEQIDSANAQGRQTLVFRPVESDAQAAFAQLDWNATERFKLVLAGRYDDSSLHEEQFSPKAAVVFGLNPNHTFRASYNEAFQVANYSEFFLQAGTVLPGTTISSFNLSAIENALRPLLGGTQLGFGRVPVLALGNEDLEVEEIKSLEFGYNGILGQKAFLTVDYYQNENTNFISDLLANVNPAFPRGRLNSNFGAYAPPSNLPAPVQAAILGALRANLPPAVFALMSNNLDGAPIIALASYTNSGKVDTQGVDVAFTYYATSNWTLDASYSWFDFEVKNDIPGDPLKPNAPANQAKAGISYVTSRWNGGLKFRWSDEFEWFVGPFRGTVPSYEVVDLNAAFDINDRWGVGLSVSNLLDNNHFEAFGGDIIERRALANVVFRW
jgi:outer membrane receptor for ferrienterochelin and colicins